MNRYEKRSLAAQEHWDELAQLQGFANEREMLECLTTEWTDEAIADLLGYVVSTIKYRRDKHGIVACQWQVMFKKLKRKEVIKHAK